MNELHRNPYFRHTFFFQEAIKEPPSRPKEPPAEPAWKREVREAKEKRQAMDEKVGLGGGVSVMNL